MTLGGGCESNIHERAITESLDERVRDGRSRLEAAGEVIFLKNLMVKHGLLSEASRDEIFAIVDGWLSSKSQDTISEQRVEQRLAREYADFLKPRVTLAPDADPMKMIDAALRDWRRRT